MKFEDIKVGDVVTTNRGVYNGDYTVVAIEGDNIILDVLDQTNSCWNTSDKDTLWAVCFEKIVDIVDPEEDLIVWGALEAGEKFRIKGISSTTYLKLNYRYYVALGSSLLRVWGRPTHWKVQLVN
ncbi:hypothetical protein PM16_19 [Proteus phage PM16]|uniref:Uncharacterized protein n=1 Tax=Proteus phage PM16 TaxID=1357704 RepID=A0A0A6ZK85_9CAUD|nr:hypothetical protein ACQ55_gp19 [Proteus phage PM16]AGZ17264.1 hypothetical protein PM16_19 [Proteus phage PM16]